MSKRKFDFTGHPCESHDVTKDVWYYVQKDGLTLCHRVGGQTGEIVVIPWRKIKRALDDHAKAKDRRHADA